MKLERMLAGVEPSAVVSGNAEALLSEIAKCLSQLLATGETSAIDLASLPLTPADRDWLRQRLGEGEVHITLNAEGESTFTETVLPGVWWVTHKNPVGGVAMELIEIAFVPELVGAHREDVSAGLERLEDGNLFRIG